MGLRTLQPKIWIPVLSFVLLCALAQVSVAQVQVTATLDKTSGTLEDSFVLTVTVEGKADSEPMIPEIDGLRIRASGTSQQIQIINGQVSRLMQYTYQIEAIRPGEFSIPAISVNANKEVQVSEPITLQIEKASQEVTKDRKIYLHAEINRTQAYVGEQLIYTLQFFRRLNTTEAHLEKPGFQGFSVETLGEQKEADRIVSGQRFRVTELRFALFPNVTGTLEISPAAITYESIDVNPNDPFARFGFLSSGRRVSGKVLSPSLSVQVSALPEPGKPAHFSGLIGTFDLKTQLSSLQATVGDSVTLTTIIRGKGNVRQMPDLGFVDAAGDSLRPALTQDFKIYDDKPVLNIRATEEGLFGEKISKKALVPLRNGTLRIPAFTVFTFDPEKKRYEILRSEEYVLTVQPAQEAEKLVVQGETRNSPPKKKVEILGEDLMPIHTKLHAVKNLYWSSMKKIVLGALGSCPPLVFGFLWLWQHRRKYQFQNESLHRSQSAYRTTKKALKQTQPLLESDSRKFLAELGKHFRIYLGDKLGVNGLSFTPEESFQVVMNHGAKEAEAQKLKKLLHLCEEAQFGAMSKKDAMPKAAEIYKQALDLLKILENRLRIPMK